MEHQRHPRRRGQRLREQITNRDRTLRRIGLGAME